MRGNSSFGRVFSIRADTLLQGAGPNCVSVGKDQLFDALRRRRFPSMKAAAPAPKRAMLAGSGTGVPPDELPELLDELPELLIGGSFGGSFIASAGAAVTVKAAERASALKKIDFAIRLAFHFHNAAAHLAAFSRGGLSSPSPIVRLFNDGVPLWSNCPCERPGYTSQRASRPDQEPCAALIHGP